MSRANRTARTVALTLGAIVLAGAGFLAGRATLAPAPAASGPAPVTVEVVERTLGRTLDLGAEARLATRKLGANLLAGVLTKAPAPGVRAEGDVLYEVAGRPVVAIAGAVPFHRPLAEGDAGPDVRQLREALVRLGHAKSVGRTFDAATARAVRAWQAKLGAPPTGRIELGELVAVGKLPAVIGVAGEDHVPGALLSGGESLLQIGSGAPEFTATLTRQQAGLIREGAVTRVEHEGRVWQAKTAATKPTDEGQVELRLTGVDGGPVCGEQCGDLAAAGPVALLAHIETQASVTGPCVPVSAVKTDPDGAAKVAMAGKGGERPVEVLASLDGQAVVRGVKVGERVLALAEPEKGR